MTILHLTFVQMFVAMLVLHVIADYPLQGDFLSKAKNRTTPLPGVPWYQALGAHALIHAGAVWLVTGSLTLGCLELIAHALIDDTKCAGRITFNMDQLAHVVCKCVWACGAAWVLM